MASELKVRRARRDDFERVRALLGRVDEAARADRKRFRRLVSTLREDLYLVERAEDLAIVGLAVIVYARGLDQPTAVVRHLLGSSDLAAALLLDCATSRAAARGCTRVELQLDDALTTTLPGIAAELASKGWRDGPRTLVRTLGE